MKRLWIRDLVRGGTRTPSGRGRHAARTVPTRPGCCHGRLARVEQLEERTLLSVGGMGDESEHLRKMVSVDAISREVLGIDLTCNAFSVEDLPDGQSRLVAPGLFGSGDGGAPELPGRLLRFALPPEADLESVSLELLGSQVSALAGTYDIVPCPIAVTDGESPDVAEAGFVGDRSMAVYGSDRVYDPQFCRLVSAEQMGRWKTAEIYYSPFAYNPVSGVVEVVPSASLLLSFELDDPLPDALAASNVWDANAAELFVNFEEALEWYETLAGPIGDAGPSSSDPADYVIITTMDIVLGSATELMNFVAMKESCGYSVAVVTESFWGGGTGDAAAENIRSWLQSHYASWGIDYVLLIGDPSPLSGDVPMKLIRPGRWVDDQGVTQWGNTPTDYYYADLTANWDANGDGRFGEWGYDVTSQPLHEVLVGRIPVYNADYATLDSILAKSIDYQMEDSIAWRRNMLLPMAISNYANQNGDGHPRTDGHELAEYIRNDIAVPAGYGTWRMYEKAGLDPVATACDQALTQSNLVSRWSNNPYGIVAWCAHGSPVHAERRVWASDPNGNGIPETGEITSPTMFDTSNVPSLDDTHPSIVVQVSCQNGTPEIANNLGHSLLANGAVATYSASRNTYYWWGAWEPSWGMSTGDNTSYAYYITDRLVDNPETETTASALQWCRENFGTGGRWEYWQNCNAFNLYGDPTIRLGADRSELPDLAGYDCYAPDSLDWGETFTLQGQVANYGSTAVTESFTQYFYLSSNQAWGDDDDVYLGSCVHSDDVPAYGYGPDFNVSLTLPASPDWLCYGGGGPFYIGMKTDATTQVFESDEVNNGPGDRWQGWDWDRFTRPFDLAGYDCYAPAEIRWGDTFNVQGQVRNLGTAAVTPPFYQRFVLSNNQVWGDGDDVYLGAYDHQDDVPAGGLGPDFNVSLTLPDSPPPGYSSGGPFYIGMQTDAFDEIAETDENNNGPGDYWQGWDWDSFLTEDRYEENDTWETAFDLRLQEQTLLSTINGLGIQRDADWYEIDLTPGYNRVVADCTFSHAEGNIDIGLVSVSAIGNVAALASSTTTTDNEHIDHVVNWIATFRYFLVVDGGASGGDAGNAYDLWWDDLPTLSEDNYEENDSLATAYNLRSDERTWLTAIDGWGVCQDSDWYEIEVWPGYERILVDCAYAYAETGTLWLALYNDAGSLLADDYTVGDGGHIDCTVASLSTPRSYFVRVDDGNPGSLYNLRWDDAPPASEDNYEGAGGNNTLETAFDLADGERVGLVQLDGEGVQNDEDWYTIEVSPGYERLAVDLLFNTGEGDIQIYLYSGPGSLITSGTADAWGRSIACTVAAPGDYYLRIFSSDSAGYHYDLWWNDLPPAVDDPYEENDVWSSAVGLNELTFLSSMAGPGIQADDDWYQIQLAPDDKRILVDCLFEHGEGNVNLALHDAGGDYLVSSTGIDDNEHIDYTTSVPGTYYIRVYGAGASNLYDLVWNGLEANHAPVLDNTGNMHMADMDEDNPQLGSLVSEIIASAGGDRITDPDPGALEGIAVTAVDNTNGWWMWSTGGSFTAFNPATLSESSALLLAADGDTRIRFVPNADYNGTIPAGITFRAWDQTSGTEGGTADTTINGGLSAFSTALETASIVVYPVNDSPILSTAGNMPLLASILEDDFSNQGTQIGSIIASVLPLDLITDVDAGALEGIAVVGANTEHGSWQYSISGGANWNALGTVSDASARLLAADSQTRIRFVPDPDYNGGTVILIRAWDQTSGTNGGTADTTVNGGTTAFSFDSRAAAVFVNSVNDAPSFIKGADQFVQPDAGSQTVVGWATAISPGPANEAAQTVNFLVATDNDPLFAVLPTIGPDGTLAYTPAPSATGSAVVTVQLHDNGGTANGGIDTSLPQTFTIQVEGVDFGDAPDPLYPTLLASDGARHLATGPTLGTLRDTESNGQPVQYAVGDDTGGMDDEDGMAVPPLIAPGIKGTPVSITVSNAVTGAYLNAWIDYNADGDWNDLGEQVAVDRWQIPGPNILPLDVPITAVPGGTYARFRLTSYNTGGTLAPTGLANDGEVEDYYLVIDNDLHFYGDTAVGDTVRIWAGTPGGAFHTIDIGGSVSTWDAAVYDAICIDGLGGNDTITIYGTNQDETVTLQPGSASVVGQTYGLYVTGVETITVDAGLGSDQVTMTGSGGSNRLYSYADYARLTDSVRSFSHRVEGFETLTVDVSGGSTDSAYLYDTPDDDELTVEPGLATFTRSAGTATETTTIAIGFQQVYTYATEGEDTAAWTASDATQNRFYGYADYSLFTEARRSFYFYARGFDDVTATSPASLPAYAYLYDSPEVDAFIASTTSATMDREGPCSDTTATGFARVYAYSTRGGADTAVLNGSSTGGNNYRGYPAYSTLYDSTQSFYHYVRGFHSVTAAGSKDHPSRDRAYLYDSPGADTFDEAFWEENKYQGGSLTDTGNSYELWIKYFDYVYARSTDSGTDDTIAVENETLLAYRLLRMGTW